jgi:hypothetical protein
MPLYNNALAAEGMEDMNCSLQQIAVLYLITLKIDSIDPG